MNQLYNTYISAELSEIIQKYLLAHSQMLLVFLLVIALLNCFIGFHLRKLWGILAGMMLGAAAAAAVCIYLEKNGIILYIAVAFGACILGMLALLLYRAGLFFLCVLLVPVILGRVFPVRKPDTLILWIILGMIAGTLTLVCEREVISVLTSLGGGFSSSMLLLLLLNHRSSLLLILAGTALSIGGLLIQFQPWQSRFSWNSDEERNRDRHRHRRRMKRIRRKRKLQERKEQLLNNSGKHPRWSGSARATSEYIPYKDRPDYQKQLKKTQPEDLSHIRQSISREVSDIYQEQKDMDVALDQLLEQEYRNTTRNL